VQWTVTVSGGRPPYQLTWEWGDGASSTSRAPAAGAVSLTHQYGQAGVYQVTIRATDTAGGQAVLQVVTIINGASLQTYGRSDHDIPGNLILIWPLLVLTMLVVLSFWLGERHQHALDEQPVFPPLL
jgi:hypothetical protein